MLEEFWINKSYSDPSVRALPLRLIPLRALLALLCTASLGSLACATELPTKQDRAEELALRDSSLTQTERASLADALADRYTRENRLQEAIWTFEEAGLFTEAKALKQRLRSELMTGELSPSTRLPGVYGEQTRLMKVGEQGPQVVTKPASEGAFRELLAYRIDQLLNLKIVPMTLLRYLPGSTEPSSLQTFIDFNLSGEVWMESWGYLEAQAISLSHPVLSGRNYPKAFRNLWLLDFLLDNRDRHGQNWIVRGSNVIIAIDNGASGPSRYGPPLLQIELLPEGETLRLLRAMRAEDFAGIDTDNNSVLSRRDLLLAAIENQREKKASCSEKILEEAALP